MTKKDETQKNFSRRNFIKKSGVALGAISALATGHSIQAQDKLPLTKTPKKTSKGLPLIVSGYKFARTEALFNGTVAIEGCDIEMSGGKIGDMNTDVF
ncbi:MAG: twin-arginine translocation signal domain-containing protein, partial [Thiotrichaceae bacterium]|nr:twin-arginine translocation signal domain-containing protein [Thiotrichaceae bacterium]